MEARVGQVHRVELKGSYLAVVVGIYVVQTARTDRVVRNGAG